MQVTETTEQRPKEAAVQSLGVGGKSGAKSTKEWVMKMANLPKDNSESMEVVPHEAMEQGIMNHPMEPVVVPNPEQSLEHNPNHPPKSSHEPSPDKSLEPSPVQPPDLVPNSEPIIMHPQESNQVQPPETISVQPPTPQKLGGDIYIEQANHIASEELRNKLKQEKTVRKNNPLVGGPMVETPQQSRKHAPISMPVKDLDKTSSSNPTLASLKGGGKGKKKEKERKQSPLQNFVWTWGVTPPFLTNNDYHLLEHQRC